jgi:predicted DNA binding CopG/RHH family protein
VYNKTKGETQMAEMKNICGKIPVELHEKVRAEIEEKETSTQIFIQQVIEEHFNRLEGKGEESMEKRTLAVQVTEDLFQRVKWAVAKEGIKQKDFLIRIIEKVVEEVEAKWKELEQPEETPEADRLEEAEGPAEETSEEEIAEGMEAAEEEPDDENFEESAQLEEEEPDSELPEDADEEDELSESEEETEEIA